MASLGITKWAGRGKRQPWLTNDHILQVTKKINVIYVSKRAQNYYFAEYLSINKKAEIGIYYKYTRKYLVIFTKYRMHDSVIYLRMRNVL